MKVLLIGSGGREHALARALAADPALTALHAAPGNPGIAAYAKLHPLAVNDNPGLLALAIELAVDLVVVGPELPLVNGLTDLLREKKIPVFGPSAAAAMLEGSKDFAKQVMRDAGVPTARSYTCNNQRQVEAALDVFGAPYVVKHDGLAAGKGVVVTNDRAEALAHALASSQVVIEEFLDGPEVSLFGISDGRNVIAMQPAQDFKRAYDNDAGLNTGGMGAYSPLPWAPDDLIEETLTKVLNPTVKEMAARGTPFIGLLYAGLALTSKGLRVIEFNARFGDPESEVLLPRLLTPLATLLLRAATGDLADVQLAWSEQSAVTVVLAAAGYPSEPKLGDELTHLVANEASYIYHAGTKLEAGKLISAGGRVLAVTGMGEDLTAARDGAYRTISQINLSGSHYRSDIALNAAVAEKGN